MSGGFRVDPEALGRAARQAHSHADQVEKHSRDLDARTRGKLLGKGKLGQIVQNAVRPVVDSMIGDMAKAMAGGHRSIGRGLELTAKNLDDAERAIHKSLRADGRSLGSEGIKLGPGQSVPGRKALRAQYHRQVDERVAQLELQGHGVGRHLKVTDQQLKDRLGKPIQERVNVPQPPIINSHGYPVAQPPQQVTRWARDEYGFSRSNEKIDPLHGPDAKQNLTPPQLYHDKEKKDQHGNPVNHSCDRFSTAFKDNESFMYAERYARARIPTGPPYEVKFSPSDAWGPGGHDAKFRGYYIDPDNPVTAGGKVNYRDVNFKDAEIVAVYKPDGKGGFNLHTMFPQPALKHNVSRHHLPH
ncbi:hypothetical protein AB0K51_23420 [Kitasatospora sp. NPDC049285]|uniref:hypothetical protein n=1 Tax=Kitasatospora sp. NPDC049285 TaxID=3157096 RepID=UPI003416F9AB